MYIFGICFYMNEKIKNKNEIIEEYIAMYRNVQKKGG